MEMPPTTRPASHRWWFRLLILGCFLIPPITELSYDPARTTDVVRAVLQQPYYCMITPVVLGVLLLFPSGVDRRTLAVASFVGLLFGLINMAVWFVSNPQDWWMGVLHIPLVVTAGLGLIDARYRPAVNPNLAAAATSR